MELIRSGMQYKIYWWNYGTFQSDTDIISSTFFHLPHVPIKGKELACSWDTRLEWQIATNNKLNRQTFQACLTPAGMLGALDLVVVVLFVGRHPDREGGGAVWNGDGLD